MLSEEQFLSWCRKLKLSPQACEMVSRIRSSQPSRRVQSARGNVSGRYPSRKMGWIVQAESHIEMAAVREMEHDIGVHEYYDQPPQIKLSYKARNGKPIGTMSNIKLPNGDSVCGLGGGRGAENCRAAQ